MKTVLCDILKDYGLHIDFKGKLYIFLFFLTSALEKLILQYKSAWSKQTDNVSMQ